MTRQLPKSEKLLGDTLGSQQTGFLDTSPITSPKDGMKSKGKMEYSETDIIKVDEGLITKDAPENDKMQYKTQGSVFVKINKDSVMSDDHVKAPILNWMEKAKQNLMGFENEEDEGVPDQLFVAQRMKMMFKQTQDDNSCFDSLFKVVEIPLNFLRNYSVPMAEEGEWNRLRAAILPLTMPFAFVYLQKIVEPDTTDSVNEYAGEVDDGDPFDVLKLIAWLLIPGALISLWIRFRTKLLDPPSWLKFTFAILAFVMSISWISFTCDIVIDLLGIFG